MSGRSQPAKKSCPICKGSFRPQVFRAHVNKCEREKRAEDGREEYNREKTKKMLAHLASYKPPVDEADEAGFPHDDFNDRSPPELCNPLETADPQPNTPQPDVVRGAAISEFRVEYHPRSQKHVKPEVYRSEEYHSAYQPSPQPPRGDSNPWGPFFNTREDFLVAELLLEAGMNKEQSERLIKIIGRCVSGKGTFTLARYADIESAWERASINLTPIERLIVSYKDKEMSYDVHHRSLWDWATDLVQDPLLAPHFHWDAEKVFRCLGDQTTRVFDEPWTADAFWDIQSQIPEGVIAQCANLPTSIRNGNGLGGGRVVGWLPIVSEDPKESKKPLFVNFKRAVWHESLHIVAGFNVQMVHSAGFSQTSSFYLLIMKNSVLCPLSVD
ncbi:hypothetical protein BC826DRAFT_1121252 [Russula brevipes]|nr:hypothetical protein BC826DRAFT_1121252 [Russula brevipes]